MALSQYEYKRIADPVHGTIGLSELEVELISTKAFQRLRNVKQLGLADLVFPGADYSRLSHSIGVCHVTGRILDSLRAYSGEEITDQEYQLYRLAGLLHDLGHFPFSHAFGDAVSDFYSERKARLSVVDTTDGSDLQEIEQQQATADSLDHEHIGRLLLEKDREIGEFLGNADISPHEVHSIFTRDEPPRFANLISSALDADRIDYLLRTANHTGLPYGLVDIDYILSQIRLDDDKRICLTLKALRTAEHFLLGRYFDYQQVSYHKTVAAFEMVLKDIVTELLDMELLDCSFHGIEEMVESGQWHQFDEIYVINVIRKLEDEVDADSVLGTKIASLLRRRSPKLIGGIEFMGERNRSGDFNRSVRDLNETADELSGEFNIDRKLWYVWQNDGKSITNIGSHLPISMNFELDEDEKDEIEQSVLILDGTTSTPIVSVQTSLMSWLAQQALYVARLYVVFPEGRENDRNDITARARSSMQHESWFDGK